MISKSQIKLITSLQQKKYRTKTGLFVAEGPKIVEDLLNTGLEMHSLYACPTLDNDDNSSLTFDGLSEAAVMVSQLELQKISALKTANTMLAVFHIPKTEEISDSGLIVALDAVRDPGNLGTIIRLCDWFGVTQLICSLDTADCYNPKVVQATMGSIARVSVTYMDLSDFLKNTKLPLFAAVMDGDCVYNTTLPETAILIMGNESNGISPSILPLVEHKITIPNFGTIHTAESLNVASATGILLSEFRRAIER